MSFIEAASLSDEEFESIELDDEEYSVEVYEALLAILDARESVSNTRDRLQYYFLARGVETSALEGTSNILVGDVLCS